VLWRCWLGGRKGIWPVKYMGDGGGGQWLVRMEWHPAGWSVCLPLLIFRCTIKSRSSLLAPPHPGGPGKRAVKRLWCVAVVDNWMPLLSSNQQHLSTEGNLSNDIVHSWSTKQLLKKSMPQSQHRLPVSGKTTGSQLWWQILLQWMTPQSGKHDLICHGFNDYQ